MANKVKVKINSAGAAAVLRDPAIQADLDSRAEQIAASANSGVGPDNMEKRPFEAGSGTGSPFTQAMITRR